MLIRRCYAGLETDRLRAETLDRLRGLLTVDAAFFATVDPATLLFTSAFADDPLRSASGEFMANEFGRADVNKFAELAQASDPVSSVDHATRGDRSASSRYVEVMAPLGLGDELRAALVSGGRCWGVICLHREDAEFGFSDRELRLVRRVAPHLAEGLRRSLLGGTTASTDVGPGVVVLDTGLDVVSISTEAEYWLAQLDPERRTELPVAVRAAAAQLRRVHELSAAPVLKVRTPAGQWLAVHASTLRGADGEQIAVVVEPATAKQLGSFLLDVHGLTPAQQRVTELLLQGCSTRQIVERLHLSPHTVQEHVRAAFDKVGVGSRRELVATLLGGH
ncbi:DNA-binding NarL/FixJ family response regulator [Kribbella sp. VKM Ac-2527]|uniref:DNA-binding NarL/FixJ family response regulator n=1 Tax=Kribbella caucasensis TaxID=2512215 RepID=A0A4R6KD07_9ACTN|nr:LuxR C-terminal-related transcriptional regulator [Kribbella sp. VKM Ac-2527]TDO47948.1 DNA-binding NarL/FixJ family response regulator [Kribbella sp. VKM Ac-2527]